METDSQRGPPLSSTWMFVFLPAFFVLSCWRTFEAAGCVPSVMSQSKNRIATRSNEWIARPFLVSPNTKIENRLEMALSKAKSGARGSVEPCDLLETRSSLHYASWALFKQQASTQLSGSPLRGPESLNECFSPESQTSSWALLRFGAMAPRSKCKTNRLSV